MSSKTSIFIQISRPKDSLENKSAWKFEKFDSEEYDRVRMIAKNTKQMGILCSYLTARRQHEQTSETVKQTPLFHSKIEQSPGKQGLKKSIEETETNPPSPIKKQEQEEPKHAKNRLRSQFQKKDEEGKSISKGKDQKQNIKRWKQEKARVRKVLSAYHPEADPINVKFSSTNDPREITKDSIASLYEVNSFSELNQKIYVQQPNEDPYFCQAFKYVFHLVKVDLIYPPQEVNLAKIKTFVVRRVLDDFVTQHNSDLSPLEKIHLSQLKRRMTKKDRQNYEKAGVSIPKSRIEKDYLLSIFRNPDFRKYFRNYVESARLTDYLRNINLDQIMKFQQEIARIQKLQLPYQRKVEVLRKISKRPIVIANIQQYQSEAKMVMLQYAQQ